ncbi:MAG: hypothetical protein ACD_30C00035G0001 [uncultured bacterium]|nr:MAG: hypothetical protein ACD_30C00035G0001 [uncultured bacterium]
MRVPRVLEVSRVSRGSVPEFSIEPVVPVIPVPLVVLSNSWAMCQAIASPSLSGSVAR